MTRLLLGVLLLLASWTAVTHAQPRESSASPTRRAVELTFLKAQPGQRERLVRFIVRNWFAMDRIAQEQQLLQHYTVLQTGTDAGPWNVVVAVTYRDERGYDGIAEAFEVIRRAHRPVLVDGKALRDLGEIVDSTRLFEDVPATGQR